MAVYKGGYYIMFNTLTDITTIAQKALLPGEDRHVALAEVIAMATIFRSGKSDWNL